jgi:adenylylsulfate kinase
MASSTNVTWHESTVGQDDRWKLAGHRGAVVWFTGLSGAGKSSVANAAESALNREHKVRTYLLDGDNIRCVHMGCPISNFAHYETMDHFRLVTK